MSRQRATCPHYGYPLHEDVHYWNESLHSESVISNGCCSTSKWSNETPSADDGAVVWRSYDRVGSEGHRTHLWDGALTDLTEASLYGSMIAWMGRPPGAADQISYVSVEK